MDEHNVIGECLKNFVEEEWANLWIRITRNNLFQMEQSQNPDAEEEKDDQTKTLASIYGGSAYGGAAPQ